MPPFHLHYICLKQISLIHLTKAAAYPALPAGCSCMNTRYLFHRVVIICKDTQVYFEFPCQVIYTVQEYQWPQHLSPTGHHLLLVPSLKDTSSMHHKFPSNLVNFIVLKETSTLTSGILDSFSISFRIQYYGLSGNQIYIIIYCIQSTHPTLFSGRVFTLSH